MIPLSLPEIEASKPLELTAIIRVRDSSGRPVERTITKPLAPETPLIGIKPLFDGAVEQGGLARFEVIGVDEDGQRTALDGVTWEASRVTTRYQWYESDGNWRYEPITSREHIASGDVEIAPGKPASIEVPVD